MPLEEQEWVAFGLKTRCIDQTIGFDKVRIDFPNNDGHDYTPLRVSQNPNVDKHTTLDMKLHNIVPKQQIIHTPLSYLHFFDSTRLVVTTPVDHSVNCTLSLKVDDGFERSATYSNGTVEISISRSTPWPKQFNISCPSVLDWFVPSRYYFKSKEDTVTIGQGGDSNWIIPQKVNNYLLGIGNLSIDNNDDDVETITEFVMTDEDFDMQKQQKLQKIRQQLGLVDDNTLTFSSLLSSAMTTLGFITTTTTTPPLPPKNQQMYLNNVMS